MKNAFVYAWEEFTNPSLRRSFYYILAIILVVQALGLVPGLIIGMLINTLSVSDTIAQNTFQIWILVGCFAGAYILKNALSLYKEKYDLEHSWFNFLDYFDKRCQEKIALQELGFFSQKDSRKQISDLRKGFDAVRQSIMMLMWQIIPTIMTCLVATCTLLIIYPQFGFIVLFANTLIFFLLKDCNRRSLSKAKWMDARWASKSSKIHELVANARDLKLSNDTTMREKLYTYSAQTYDHGKKAYWTLELWYNRITITQIVFITLIVALGVFRITQGSLRVGDLAIIVGWFGTSVGQLSQLSHLFRRLNQNQSSIIRLHKAIEAPVHTTSEISKKSIWVPSAPITFRDVVVTYSENGAVTSALNGVNMKIPIGSFVALVGKSGAGKSTISNILLGAKHHERGDVLIGGIPIQHIDTDVYYNQLVYIPQEKTLFSYSLRDNLLLGNKRDVADSEIIEVLQKIGLDRLITRLDANIGEGGKNLSGGERQRVLIARAMLRTDAHLVIMDEPTSDLDVFSEEKVREAILDMRISGKTIIMIAHRLNTVQHADIIYVLKEGVVISGGTHHELIDSCSLYSEMVKKGRVA